MEELPRINGLEVTHVFKRTNQDCIVLDSKADMKAVMFLDVKMLYVGLERITVTEGGIILKA